MLQRSGSRPLLSFGSCIAVVALLVLGCSSDSGSQAYRPGLGEIMTLTQMRHAKLWLAARVGNWRLADYEVDEIEEGFADVVKFHPRHRGSQVPLDQAVPIMTGPPLAALRDAIDAKDLARFTAAFDALTTACNDCHQKTNFAFNKVVRPTGNPYVNQDFTASR
jgi:hypothetical protein